MKETKVSTINEFGEKLVGIETTPLIQQDKYPTVVLVHGFDSTKGGDGSFDNLAKNISKAGFLVYRFDFSGCGESEGEYSQTSLFRLKSDLSKILDFVRSQSKVDSSRIGILGHSFGTAIIIALRPKVRCFVMTGSIAHPKEIMAKLFGRGYNPNGISTRIKQNGQITKIKPQFWKDLKNHDLLDSIIKIHCPVLFVHGSGDDKVPVCEPEAYFQNANEPKEKIIIDGANHGLDTYGKEMNKNVVAWFKKYLF